MARRSLATRLGVVTASLVALVVGVVVASTVLTPHPRPAAAGTVAAPQESDHCYVEGMLLHHAQALELSELVLAADGVAERVRTLAGFIVADQSAEMQTMTAWSAAWDSASAAAATEEEVPALTGSHAGHGESTPAPTTSGCTRDVHASMSGMATPEQLRHLADADGPVAQRMFLELMIVHHEGALTMAEDALVVGANAFVRSSAKHVLVEQEREIDAMTNLLAETP